MRGEAEAHLTQACRVMAYLIEKHGACPFFEHEFRPFQTLVRSIISQQISTKAAATIKQRLGLITPGFMPKEFLSVSPASLRRAGLSASKTRYIIELAQRVSDGRLDLESMQRATDVEVVTSLTALPGIGKWTSQMFLIFGLRRPDVLPLADAGLQRAARLLFGEEVNLEEVGKVWQPFRSVASWYLWKAIS